MKKKYIVIIVIAIALFVLSLSYTMAAGVISSEMQETYDTLSLRYPSYSTGYTINDFSTDVWDTRNILVLDVPFSTITEADGTLNHMAGGEWKYIGVTPTGEPVNNPDYLDTITGSAVINTYTWNQNGDPNTKIDTTLFSTDEIDFFGRAIFEFLETEYGTRFDNRDNPEDWIKRAIVLIPPTRYGRGVLRFEHEWDSDGDGILETWYLTVNMKSEIELDGPNPPGPAMVTGIIATTGTMSANAVGVINADTRDSEKYDTNIAIPSSENLYVNVLANDFLIELETENINVTDQYLVNVYQKFKFKWNGGLSTDTDTKLYSYYVDRSYNITDVKRFELFGLDSALINNSALPTGSISMLPIGYTAPNAVFNDTDYAGSPIITTTHPNANSITYDSATKTIEVRMKTDNVTDNASLTKPSTPSKNFTSFADSLISKFDVSSDTLVVNGSTIIDGTVRSNDATVPTNSAIPSSVTISRDMLYANGLTIPDNTINGSYISNGSIRYQRILSHNTIYTDTIDLSISTVNSVEVHTPVVCYPVLTEDPTYLQVIDKNSSVENIVIDRSFNISYPNTGQHITALGYGNNDYEDYIAQKQIKFDFDIYLGSDRTGTFISKDTWFDLDKTRDNYEFFIPHWVEEGSGAIVFRVIPINDVSNNSLYEYNSNVSNSNYRAVENINVSIVGQLYDFEILSTTDPMFNEFFFTGGTRDNSVFVGGNDKNGNSVSSHDDILPIMPGTNTVTGYENKVIKKGHSIFFSLKTVGNMSNSDDFVTLEPTFYYVDSAGNNRQEVDIWYKSLGSYLNLSANKIDLKMGLNNNYTGISSSELTDTATGLYSLYGSPLTLSEYQEEFVWQDSKTSNKVGDTNLIALDEDQRTFIGEISSLPGSVSMTSALMGRQKYYGMYMIPSSSIFVPVGTTSENVISSKLTDGYIIIQFNVSTIDGFTGDPTDIHLSYDKAEGNMYNVEGFNTTQNGFVLQLGDTAFYYTDKAADSDYNSITTH